MPKRLLIALQPPTLTSLKLIPITHTCCRRRWRYCTLRRHREEKKDYHALNHSMSRFLQASALQTPKQTAQLRNIISFSTTKFNAVGRLWVTFTLALGRAYSYPTGSLSEPATVRSGRHTNAWTTYRMRWYAKPLLPYSLLLRPRRTDNYLVAKQMFS